MSGKLLQKLEAVHFMLAHHTSEHFGFLEEHTRNRTVFYHILSRLLFMEDTPSNFKSFVAPLQQVQLRAHSLYACMTAMCVKQACWPAASAGCKHASYCLVAAACFLIFSFTTAAIGCLPG